MHILRVALLVAAIVALPAAAYAAGPGDNWQRYKERFIRPDGRVLDTGNADASHSEGQGAGMLLAVAHNDRATFERIWEWTRRNLALRDDGLFVWRLKPGQTRPDDMGNATDGDITIAWAMARAGARWKETRYTEIARGLARAIRARLIVDAGNETVLLPGPGWPRRGGATILNLSYWVFPGLQELARLDPSPQWDRVTESGVRLIERARFGKWELPSDWLVLQSDGKLTQAENHPFVFGYEAVRIPLYYLWAGYDRKDVLRVYQAFWAATGKGQQLVTTLGLATNSVLQQENVLGFRAVNDLVNCGITGEASALLSGGFDKHHDYYSATLFMLAQLAVAERLPQCRADSVLAGAGTCLKTSADGAVGCPLADPIAAKVEQSAITVRLLDVAQLPSDALRRPLARVSAIVNAGDGSGRLFIATRDGVVHVLREGKLLAAPFLDLRKSKLSAFVLADPGTGLVSLAFHPEYALAGRPGYGRVYTAHSERPTQRADAAPLLNGKSGRVHHVGVISEWRVDPKRPDAVAPDSQREILRVALPAPGRTIGRIAFEPRLTPGAKGYGLLYIGIGDGGADTPRPDDTSREAQQLDSPLGKILRIQPDPGRKGPGYKVPPENPFVARKNDALPEIWALGLRYPESFAWDRGKMLITDSGGVIQEVNLGQAGANYGWNLREGAFAKNFANPEQVYSLADGEAARGYTFPVLQYDRDEGAAAAGGLLYRGKAIPSLAGKYLFTDLVSGKIMLADAQSLSQGRIGKLENLGVVYYGIAKPLLMVLNDDTRADVRLGEDESGEIYAASDRDGKIRKIVADAAEPRAKR